jgi:hypothetical protein
VSCRDWLENGPGGCSREILEFLKRGEHLVIAIVIWDVRAPDAKTKSETINATLTLRDEASKFFARYGRVVRG